jgi:hypothetical protein
VRCTSSLHLPGPFELAGGQQLEFAAGPRSMPGLQEVTVENGRGHLGHAGQGHGGLLVEVHFTSEDLRDVDRFANLAAYVRNAVSLLGNVATAPPWLHYGFGDDGTGTGPFIQQSAPTVNGVPQSVQRSLDVQALADVLRALVGDQEPSATLAATRYSEALAEMAPGKMRAAVGPMWIAAEALEGLAQSELAVSHGLPPASSREAVARVLGIDTTVRREKWVRRLRRQIFILALADEDEVLWKRLYVARNVYMHSGNDFEAVMKSAVDALPAAAGIIRRAILERLVLEDSTRTAADKVDDYLQCWSPTVRLGGSWTADETHSRFAGLSLRHEASDAKRSVDPSTGTITTEFKWQLRAASHPPVRLHGQEHHQPGTKATQNTDSEITGRLIKADGQVVDVEVGPMGDRGTPLWEGQSDEPERPES